MKLGYIGFGEAAYAMASGLAEGGRVEQYAQSRTFSYHGTPEDIGNAVAFLASDKASYITGVTLRIDGGLILPGMPEGFAGQGGLAAGGWGRPVME